MTRCIRRPPRQDLRILRRCRIRAIPSEIGIARLPRYCGWYLGKYGRWP